MLGNENIPQSNPQPTPQPKVVDSVWQKSTALPIQPT